MDLKNGDLCDVYYKSIQERSCLPLIKEELRCKIQCRRLSKGDEELKVEIRDDNPVHQLSEEEVIKRNRRRTQNRHSAAKRRMSEKQHETDLLMKINRLEEENRKMEKEKHHLSQERAILHNLIHDHNCRMKLGLRASCKKFVSLLKHPSTMGVLITQK